MVGQLRTYSDAGGDILFGTDIGYTDHYDTTEEFTLEIFHQSSSALRRVHLFYVILNFVTNRFLMLRFVTTNPLAALLLQECDTVLMPSGSG